MTIIRVKGIKRYKSNGQWYCYHRGTGQRILAAPGTPEFMAEIDRLNGLPSQSSAKAGSLGGLITAYRASPEFLGLAPLTRSDYQKVFDWLQKIDDTAVKDIDSALVIGLRDKAYTKHKRRFANYVVQVLSLLFNWGKPRKWANINPAADVPKIRRPKSTQQRNRPWSEKEMAVVLEDFQKAPALLPGLALGMFAALTEGDAVSLPWAAYSGDRLAFDRGKTGVEVDIPAHRQLRAILDATPRKSPVIMVNERDKPYTLNGFRAMFFKRIRALEKAEKIRPGLTFHGLRHTVGTALADAGATDREIMSVLGHATEKMAQHYSKGASRRRSGTAAITKLERKRKPRV